MHIDILIPATEELPTGTLTNPKTAAKLDTNPPIKSRGLDSNPPTAAGKLAINSAMSAGTSNDNGMYI